MTGWIGRLTVVLSYITIYLGMRQYGANGAIGGVFWASVGLFLIIYFALDLYRYILRFCEC